MSSWGFVSAASGDSKLELFYVCYILRSLYTTPQMALSFSYPAQYSLPCLLFPPLPTWSSLSLPLLIHPLPSILFPLPRVLLNSSLVPDLYLTSVVIGIIACLPNI